MSTTIDVNSVYVYIDESHYLISQVVPNNPMERIGYLSTAPGGFEWPKKIYLPTSDIRRTKSQNLDVSRFALQLSLLNLLKPGAQSSMKV